MTTDKFLYINNKKVKFENEKNILEIIRAQNIDIPTFCYHSELSTYGACRLCMVDVEGRGVVASCSTPPMEGLKIKTHTHEIQEIRKINLELLLANHHDNCTSCVKNTNCKLQSLAARFGINEIRFKKASEKKPLDFSSPSLVRDPNKCILCGDCVRYCEEIQGIGAIGFVNRGSQATVSPPYLKDIDDVECINCGGCASVCPTGAITPKSNIDDAWRSLNDKQKMVVVQIAPAVRVAIGEMFGISPSKVLTGKMVNALKMLGFDQVYDTSFAADLTVMEEANEFIKRKTENKNLPLFTSCCPAWVKKAELFDVDILPHLSTCKSPQQMFGSVARKLLPEKLGVEQKDLVVVSIMPCTAKKFEAQRPEFETDGARDVDIVLTTQELGKMIKEAGILLQQIEPEPFDLPFGFATGAGIIFGNSGGVSEAVLRYASTVLADKPIDYLDLNHVRGDESLREFELKMNDNLTLKLAVVFGLKNVNDIIRQIKNNECQYDLIEVMACPGGCISGGGQPVHIETNYREERAKGIYQLDKTMAIHSSNDNPYISNLYKDLKTEPNSDVTHKFLHTHYNSRKKIVGEGFSLIESSSQPKLEVKVCIGTNCYLKGSHKILNDIIKYVEDNKLEDMVHVKATFCMERCDKGPNVMVGDKIVSKASNEEVITFIAKAVTAAKS